jgi:ubiquinone/menaquinone biosynthesis C-methylase UbiE
MSDVHAAAQLGYCCAADVYQRGRPDYPDALRGWLRAALALGDGTTAVDLGAGTGKFTRLLRDTGTRVVAVEPVAGMLAQLRQNLPEVMALAGTAQKLPLAPGTAEAVTCAQAFHWFAGSAALEEIHRVLKPSGKLGLVWNVRDESVGWVAAVSELMRPYEAGVPRFHSGQWRRAFNGTAFSDLHETIFAYEHVGSAQAVIIDRVLSVSFISALPDAQKQQITAQLWALIDAHPELKGRERVAFPYQTRAYVCTRSPG